MSMKIALAKLSATAAGTAMLAGGALHVAEEQVGEYGYKSVKEDPELAESTAIFVLPEFGRNKNLNSRRGLDHGDGSDDLRYVSGVVWGPGFAKGRVVKDDVRTIDAMYSACDALGAAPALAKGQKLKRLLA